VGGGCPIACPPAAGCPLLPSSDSDGMAKPKPKRPTAQSPMDQLFEGSSESSKRLYRQFKHLDRDRRRAEFLERQQGAAPQPGGSL